MSYLCAVDWCCFNCGDQVVVITNNPPPMSVDGTPHMLDDGDLAVCVNCGFQGQVSCDTETPPYYTWDETTPRNFEAAERYDAYCDALRAKAQLARADLQAQLHPAVRGAATAIALPKRGSK